MTIEITQCANGWMVRDAPDVRGDIARDPRQYMVFETMPSLLAYIGEAMALPERKPAR